MDVKFTARRFRARADIKQYAIDEVNKLEKYYDGILSADVILSYERSLNSIKSAEVNLHVYGSILTATEGSDDYFKSVDAAVGKLIIQVKKYKSKLRGKNKEKVRSLREIE